jgi:hypothetical protein
LRSCKETCFYSLKIDCGFFFEETVRSNVRTELFIGKNQKPFRATFAKNVCDLLSCTKMI